MAGRRTRGATSACVVALAILAACGSRAASPSEAPTINVAAEPARRERIVLGAVLPLTGADAEVGGRARRGIELAVARRNEAGGVLGRAIDLELVDSRSTDDGAARAARVALGRGAAVLLGEMTSQRTWTVAEAARPSGVPVLSPTASDPEVLDLHRVHSMGRYPGYFGRITGRYLVSRGWLDLAGLAHPTWEIASAGRPVLRAGGRLVAKGRCPPGQATYRADLERIQRANPQVVVVVCSAADAPVILREARALGIQAPLVAGPAWDHPSIVADPGSDGLHVVTYFHPDDPAAADFVAAYQARHGAPPDGVAALAHDAAAVALDAIARAGSTDPDALDAALERTPVPDMVIVRVSNGATVFLERMPIR